jgi:O-glycosyl hydrolase
MEQPVTLFTLAGGALGELFDREIERVAADIIDLNTEADAARTITIKVKIKPDKDRGFGAVDMFVSSTLGQPKGVASMMYFGRKNGRAVAVENVPAQKELFDSMGPRPVVEFKQAVNKETGEVING